MLGGHLNRPPRDFRVEHVRVEVSTIGPDDRSDLWVQANLCKFGDVSERSEDASELKPESEIELSRNAILKAQTKPMTAQVLNFNNVLEHGATPMEQRD